MLTSPHVWLQTKSGKLRSAHSSTDTRHWNLDARIFKNSFGSRTEIVRVVSAVTSTVLNYERVYTGGKVWTSVRSS